MVHIEDYGELMDWFSLTMWLVALFQLEERHLCAVRGEILIFFSCLKKLYMVFFGNLFTGSFS